MIPSAPVRRRTAPARHDGEQPHARATVGRGRPGRCERPRRTRGARVLPLLDGKPMADNMWQAEAILNAMVDLMGAHPQAMVAADIFVYLEEGNRNNKIVPDVLVGLGLGAHKRRSYYVWEEGKPPDWVLEVASPRTQAEDRGSKRRRYAGIGVPEYWLFDPTGDVYPRGTPDLQGLKLVGGEYVPLGVADGGRPPADPQRGAGLGRAQGWRTASLPRRGDGQGCAALVRNRGGREAGTEGCRAGINPRRTEAARASREAAARSAAQARVAELEAALRRRSRTGRSP